MDRWLGKRVLVVDDDPCTLDALGGMLRAAGYSVATALSAYGALVELENVGWRPDLVLLDLFMPGMDGWELTTRIRSDPSTSDLPIVVMGAGEPALLAAAPSGAAYLSKPITAQELLGAVVDMLTIAQAHAAR